MDIMDKEKIEQRVVIGNTSTETLLNLAKKSKFSVLAEKYLNLASNKNKTILKSLKKEKKRNRLFWIAFSMIPLAVFVPFFIDDFDIQTYIISNEHYCRLSTGISLGLVACTYLMLSMSFSSSFIMAPIVAYIVYVYATDEFFYYLFETYNKRFAFFLIVLGHGVVPIAYLYATIWQAIKSGFTKIFRRKPKDEKEIEQVLQAALDASFTVQKEELDALIDDYDPELAGLLGGLKAHKKQASEPKSDSKQQKGGYSEGGFALTKPVGLPPQPNRAYKLPIYIGYDVAGKHHSIDLDKIRNLVVGGAQGGGKSNFIKHIVQTLLGKADIIIVDPEEVDFVAFHNPPHVQVTTAEQGIDTLKALRQEMRERKALFLNKGINKLDEWLGGGKPKKIVLIIDEYAELYIYPEFQTILCSIARVGRKYGINIILATQRPDAKTINPQIRANFLATMAFRVANKTNARILEAPNANNIPLGKQGLGYFVMDNQPKLIQTPLSKPIQKKPTWSSSGQQVVSPLVRPAHPPKNIPNTLKTEVVPDHWSAGQRGSQVVSKWSGNQKNTPKASEKPISSWSTDGQEVVRDWSGGQSTGQGGGQVTNKWSSKQKNALKVTEEPISSWSAGGQGGAGDQEGGQVVSRWSGTGHLEKSRIAPSHKQDNNAFFIAHEDLAKTFGHDPAKQGFLKTRATIGGKRKRGYWAKLRKTVNHEIYEKI